jgi:type IV secretion system protein TrbL
MFIDAGAITLVQTTFLQNLNNSFSTVASYALNLLYLFAALELVLFGLGWALRNDVGLERLFFLVLRIGLIFLIIQNYPYLLNIIIKSFGQIAGTTTNSGITHVVNPAQIWQFGYNVGLHLLQMATKTNNFGFTMILISLGMGILITFGLLGIQVVLQVVGFYMVGLIALILLPFGAFNPSKNLCEKALQSIFQAGARVMVLIVILGIGITVFKNFELINLVNETTLNIAQPLGLFFTALLFLCLSIFLPKIVTNTVGSFKSFGAPEKSSTTTIIAPAHSSPPSSSSNLVDFDAATSISNGFIGTNSNLPSTLSSVAEGSTFAPNGYTQSAAQLEKAADQMQAAATAIENKSISENTIKQLKALLKDTK